MAFTFSPYLGWNNGVERYELYRQLEDKTGYVLYNTYPNPTKDSFENGKDHYGQRYRIKAYELNGDRISWSNDIIMYYDPIIFVPNAFTPDANGRNEIFRPECSGGKDFKMTIFTRWGEKIFETSQLDAGWDGIYKGKIAQDGVYVYFIEFKDYKDKIYQFNGTLHLLR
jgi:gliding motility-associated-like protein